MRENGLERVLLIGSLTIVLIVELLNSAVEAAVDRIGKERHKLSGRAKDMGSAAVLLSLLLAILTWALILFERVSIKQHGRLLDGSRAELIRRAPGLLPLAPPDHGAIRESNA